MKTVNQEQIERIRTMECAYHKAGAALYALQRALTDYEAALPQFQMLAGYLESPEWLQDYDADAQGLIPASIPRGVLSQDALYDLLSAHRDLPNTMRCLEEKTSDARSDAK